jgi:AraC family transcriptional regulator
MNATSLSRQTYIARINRVVNYIDAHLADPLDLDSLAHVANFSAWHFHRVFQGITGETLADCVRRRRLESAAQFLLRSPKQTALHIALQVGFASAEVFSRVFKSHFGCTPTAWRAGAWQSWATLHKDQQRKIHQAQRKEHQDIQLLFRQDSTLWPTRDDADQNSLNQGKTMQVEIKTLPSVRVAYLRHTGPYGNVGIPKAWDRFATWCGARGLMAPRRVMWGVSHDNPNVTAPEFCRYDCCIEVEAAFQPEGEIGVQQIAGGLYACQLFTGNSETIAQAWMQLYGQWMPSSGYQPADGVSLELYPADFAIDPVTNTFTFWLCAPVMPF